MLKALALILLNISIARADHSELSRTFDWQLSPVNMCSAHKKMRCHEDNALALRTPDGRCACLPREYYFSKQEDPDRCQKQRPCSKKIARWTTLHGDNNKIIGCGCYITQFGKLSAPEGYASLFSAHLETCKKKEEQACENPNKIFVRAHDGRCGCVAPEDFKPSSLDRCEIRPLNPVKTDLAFLFSKNKLVGCGYFSTNPVGDKRMPK